MVLKEESEYKRTNVAKRFVRDEMCALVSGYRKK
jgi:hypothetical protein